MSKPKLFLVDGHALLYRSFFAIKTLKTSLGQPTNAVFGFINTLRKILRDYQPEYAAICFDSGKKTLRQEKFQDYKINRPKMPDDLISQISLVKKTVLTHKIPIFEMEGFEADDLIATIAEKFQDQVEVVVVSDDKDMLQLLNERIKIFSIRKDKVLGDAEVKDMFGIEPAHIVDYIALAGDKTDNIPGVLGIGDVTARQLINQFGTIENILEHVEEIPQAKVKEKLIQQKANAMFSKELALLDRNIPLKVELEHLKVLKPEASELYELFKELEFRRFAEESAPAAPQIDVPLQTLENKKDFSEFIGRVKGAKEFSFMLNAEEPLDDATCIGMILGIPGPEAFSVEFNLIGELKEIFEDPDVVKITHNVKQGMKVLQSHNCAIRGKIFDVMLAAFLLSPAQAAFDVSALAWVYLKASLSAVNRLSLETVRLLDLYPVLLRELKDKALLKLFEEIEMPLAYVLFRMEKQGVRLDEKLLQQLSVETQKKIEDLICQVYEMAGMECNLNSPKQLSELLFVKLKLPVIKKTKTGFSTDEGVLTKLAEKHKIAALILEFRQLAKLKSTYFDALPKMINPTTGRVHAYFNQIGAETGRLSSVNPNLQNIPIRTELGRQVRKAFIPLADDQVILSADYSQIELRILAHMSQDKNLMKAFEKDQDVHNYTAALIFDVKEEDVTFEMRNVSKRVNFGIIYGMSAFGLSKDLGISQMEAQTFIDKYFLRYPNVKIFMDESIRKAEEHGYVLTILNRRRYLPEIESPNINIRQMAERQAINTPVQGSAADLMKLAMINIQKELEAQKLKSQMIITVHDELVFNVHPKEEKLMIELVIQHMEKSMPLSVPIKASIKIGKNWLNMTPVNTLAGAGVK